MLDLRDLQTLQVSQEAQLMRRYDDSPGNQDIMNAVMKHMLYGDSCHDLIPRQRVREPRGHAASSRRQLPGNRNDDRPRTPYQKRSKAQDESPSTFVQQIPQRRSAYTEVRSAALLCASCCHSAGLCHGPENQRLVGGLVGSVAIS